jgi:hypothetical protein
VRFRKQDILTVTIAPLTYCLQSDQVYSASAPRVAHSNAQVVRKERPIPVAFLNACAGEKNASIVVTGIEKIVVPGGGGERK